MNNFGVTDLRIVTPEASALAPPFDARDADDRPHHPAAAAGAAPSRTRRAPSPSTRTGSSATPSAARPRTKPWRTSSSSPPPPRGRAGNLPVVDAREAVKRIADAAKHGRVAVVFGNEAGLTNDELRRANLGVMIPTAGHEEMRASARRRSKQKYTGGAGPTSLNLSHAVGVLAYELHSRFRDAEVRGFGSGLVTVGERKRLAEELASARFAMEVLRPRSRPRGGAEPATGWWKNLNLNLGLDLLGGRAAKKGPAPGWRRTLKLSGDGGGGGGGGPDGGCSGCFVYSESDTHTHTHSARDQNTRLNAGPIASRNHVAAEAARMLSTRRSTRALGDGSRGARRVVAARNFEEAEAEGRPTPRPTTSPSIRKRLGTVRGGLTAREMERAARRRRAAAALGRRGGASTARPRRGHRRSSTGFRQALESDLLSSRSRPHPHHPVARRPRRLGSSW